MAAYTAAYPAPYQQPHHSRNYLPRPPPPNWVPPPFNGPPPIPTGITVNPQQWQAGFWKPNPAWNGARPAAQQPHQQQQQQPQPQHTLWIPSQYWTHQQQKQQQPAAARPQQPQQQQTASFNPYKRVIQPPSAEYLATKLSDNPLGLTGMKPATTEEYYQLNKPVEEQHTPWIWNPANLDDEDDDSASSSRRSSKEREPESFTSQLELKPTFSPSIVRTPQHYRDSPSPTAHRRSRGSADSGLSAQMANLSTKPSLSRTSTMPSFSTASSSDFKSPPMPAMFLSAQLSDEPDSILSPLIIAKTPKPLPPASLSRTNGVRNNHPNPILATQSLDAIPEAPAPYYRVAGNESTHATPKPRPREVPSSSHVNNLPTSPSHAYQQHQTPALPRSQTDWEEVKKQREREAEYREREREQERVEREQRRQQREQREREQQERERERDLQEREQRERERLERERREQRERERDLQEREQRDRERLERERREQRTGIGSRHTVTTYVDPYVSTSAKHSPVYGSRPSPTSGSAHPSPTHYTPPRQIQAQSTPPITSPTTTATPRPNNPLPPPPEPSNRIPLTTTAAAASTPNSTSNSTSSSSKEPYRPPPKTPNPLHTPTKLATATGTDAATTSLLPVTSFMPRRTSPTRLICASILQKTRDTWTTTASTPPGVKGPSFRRVYLEWERSLNFRMKRFVVVLLFFHRIEC
ncbi:hypothetical protein M413DRAFT_129535 [Hebeloma cylindrosporum]|uniref:Uncharacterized protein n=1 Tax=Hebeloma cylindrosporum TaxID=76867 RepID=A0A0C3CDC3_HEBCY|nr:hypothetical protein M413DRAFT_129535 [Hebeloma cylindrosporum h7]